MADNRNRSCQITAEGIKLIEKIRKERGWNKSQLEEYLIGRTEIQSISRVLRIKRGEKNTIDLIAIALDISPTDLVDEKEWFGLPESSETKASVVNWRSVSKGMLEDLKRLTTEALTAGDGIRFDFDDVFVPLGVVERQERTKRNKDDGAPDRGSELYEEKVTPITHDVFFKDVLLRGNTRYSNGKRIAVIGEAGAGKTTQLQKIGSWLLREESDDIPVWISLTDLGAKSLKEYLLENWVREASGEIEVAPQAWKESLGDAIKAGKVWLLLDGVDEMTVSYPLSYLSTQLNESWLKNVRVVLTCRVNVWDGGKNALTGFDVYRNLDFDYPDDVYKFIGKWFARTPDLAESLIQALEQSGKERIRDMVKNPLRLTLLCFSWQKLQGGLPETKAGLYEWFVNTFYDWKREEVEKVTGVEINSSKIKELNKALGELAKAAIDSESSRFRLTETFIRNNMNPDLFDLADKLNWLNKVGDAAENSLESVYAFYHPSFQEYFAALAIDDWDSFLPSNHIDKPAKDQNDKYKEYRIFEDIWQEVILFWVGRKNQNIDKESFIKALIEFEDGCKAFYWHRAYFLASTCLIEFKDCKFAERIIEQIIEWSLDCSIDHIRSQASETLWDITRGNMNIVIPLIKVLTNSKFNDDRYWIVEDSLRKIVIGNQNDISIFDQILQNPQISEEVREIVLRTSKRITISDTSVIFEDDLQEAVLDNSNKANELLDKLINFLGHEYISMRNMMPNLEKIVIEAEKSVCNYTCISYLVKKTIPHEYGILRAILSDLQKIPKVNQNAISSLEYILQNEQLDSYTRYLIARTLGEIDIGNLKAVSDLIKIFHNPQSIKGLRDLAAESLIEIGLYTPNIIGVWLRILKDSEESNHMQYMALVGLQETVDKLESKEIDGEHINEIRNLMANFLEKPDIDRCIHYIASDILGTIDPNNNLATTALTQILLKGKPHYFHEELYCTVLILEKILEKRSLDLWKPIVVSLRDGISNEAYANDIDKYENCHRVLSYCSANMSYSDFYNAWHSTVNTIQCLESQLIDCDAIQKELDRNTDHPEICCLVIDIHQIEQEIDPNVIAKKLTNKIFNSIGRRIPVVQDVSCLERELLNLKLEPDFEKLAISLYGKSTNEAINQLCQNLLPSIQIRPFTGGQTSEQLTNEVKAWLRRINLEYN